MPIMKFRLQCMSMTRQSNYTVPCNGVGILCKNGNIRCKNHGGKSTGATSPEGKLKSIKNLKQYRDHEGINYNGHTETGHHSGTDVRNSADKNLPSEG